VVPFVVAGDMVANAVKDAWTMAMLSLWSAGLWLLRLVWRFLDALVTPDLSEHGPGGRLYQVTFWIAGTLCLLMGLVQLGVAAGRRDGRGLARLLIGLAQFAGVWAAWLTYDVVVVAAFGGLTSATTKLLLSVDTLSAWQPWAPITTADITDPLVATVLGLMGLLLWISAIGHLLVVLTRAGSLMVLAATTPISAAGLVSDAGRPWFWKSLRWFHAAAATPLLMVLVIGVGVQMAGGVATGLTDRVQDSIGTAVPGILLILISCFVPLALFKLLAFVDPSTGSGAAFRAGMSAVGGIQGLLGGHGASGGSTASAADEDGRSQGESHAQAATTSRFGQVGQLGGFVGQQAARALGVMQSVAGSAAAVGSDLTNQMGVGHHSYHPDERRRPGSGDGQQDPDLHEAGPQDGGQDGGLADAPADAPADVAAQGPADLRGAGRGAAGAGPPPPRGAPPGPPGTDPPGSSSPPPPGGGSARGAAGGAPSGGASGASGGGAAGGGAAAVPVVPV